MSTSVKLAFHGLTDSPSITGNCKPSNVHRFGECVRVSVGTIGTVSFACNDLAKAISLECLLKDVVLA